MLSVNAEDLKFKAPFNMIIGGPSLSGKTTLLLKFLENRKNIISPAPLDTLYCYGHYHSQIPLIEKMGVKIHDGVPTQEIIDSLATPKMLIIDDLMSEMQEKDLILLFTKFSHHQALSIVLLVQDLFYKTLKIPRTNAHYLILTKSLNAALKIKTLGSHLFAGNLPYFMESYQKAVNKNFGYILIDLHPASDPNLRLRTNIFDEHPIVFLPTKNGL